MFSFSIIIPTYNRADLLPLAIKSVLAQTMPDWELIIVDDGSTDETRQSVAPFLHDARIRYLYKENEGRSVARNTGAAVAQHPWLLFLDSDDELTPNALADHQSSAVMSGAGMLIGGVDIVDADGQMLSQRSPWQTNGTLDLEGWLFDCYGQPSSVAIQSQWFVQTVGFQSQFDFAEDWKLYLDLAVLRCPMAWTMAQVCRYRQHDDNTIHDIQGHLDTSLRVLGDMASVVEPALLSRATAWANVVGAQRHFAAHQFDAGRTAIDRAVRLYEGDDSWRIGMVEMVFTDVKMPEMVKEVLLEAGFRPKLIRQARARLALATYYRTQQRRDLYRAVCLDPRWLRNRGVLSSLVQTMRKSVHVTQ